jgi:tetratricopeptide (TPR) repeat protein
MAWRCSVRSITLVERGVVVVSLVAFSAGVSAQTSQPADKIPITTASDEARTLYLQGRDLAERLRATDARRFYEQAVAKDPNFALGYLGLANTSGTNKEFTDAVTRAVASAAKVSEGERHMVLALDAGLKGEPAKVLAHYTDLVRVFPNDERAHNLLGTTYFGRQEYEAAIKHYVKATTINPSFSPSYNQLGYAYRFLEKFGEAEQAFKKYTELIPGDPNPYDSYAELLLKMGRFDESIKMYEKALSIDPNFVASYVGIGNNYLATGRFDQARSTFAKLASVARTTGERRQAHFWNAASYVYEGATDKALAELKAGYDLAAANNDFGTMSGDLTQMGDVLREAGRPDEALAKYTEAVAMIEKAQVPEEVKQATRRNHVFEEGRVAIAKNDIATAKSRLTEYAKQVAGRKAPFEVRQQHELAGMIALSEKRYKEAAQEFAQANQQDPRVLSMAALAWKGAGDAPKAAAFAAKAEKFNGLSFNSAHVKSKAGKTSTSSAADRQAP